MGDLNKLKVKLLRIKRNDRQNGRNTPYGVKAKRELTARVCSNIERPWYGKAALTINIGRV